VPRLWAASFLIPAKNTTKTPPKIHHAPATPPASPGTCLSPLPSSLYFSLYTSAFSLSPFPVRLQYGAVRLAVRVRSSKSPMFMRSSTGLRLQPPKPHPPRHPVLRSFSEGGSPLATGYCLFHPVSAPK
jgi:hypothetical protein